MKLTSKQKGIFFLVLSALCFAIMSLFVKLSGDLPSVQKAFFRNSIAAVASAVILIRSGAGFKFQKQNLPFFLMRAGFGTIGIVCNFYALDHLILADASILAKLAPFFTIVFSFLFLREKIKPYQIFAVIVAFIASLLIIKPSFGPSAHVKYTLIAAFGGMMAGAAYTCVRLLSVRNENKGFIVFFFSVFSTVVLFPLMIIFYVPMSVIQVVLMLCAALFGTIAQFALTTAYSYAPAGSISVYDYTQILFSALLGFIAFGEIPDIYSFIGCLLIFGVGLFMFIMGNEKAEQKSASK